MLQSQVVRMSEKRYLILGALLVALLAILPLPAAAGGISGDAAYDPAAGAHPELSVAVAWSSFGGDDAYDPAAGAHPELFRAIARSFSGDDAYDPAAGGLGELAGNWTIEAASCFVLDAAEVGSYSGDDAYDPAVVRNLPLLDNIVVGAC